MQAVITGRNVGRNENVLLGAPVAFENTESVRLWIERHVSRSQTDDSRHRRCFAADAPGKGVDQRSRSLDFNHHAAGIVQNIAGKATLGGEPVNKRTEANTLHHAGDLKFAANGRAPALRVFFLGWHDDSAQWLVY